jgi:electron transfer flavoprotein beta subunit
MNIVVCVKQVPDIEGRVVVEKGIISVQAMVSSDVVNPQDLLAIEEAIRIKDESGNGTVTLISLGPSETEETLRKCIAMGADDAILLDDSAFVGGDSYATANTLAVAIRAIPHDIILCGQRADDSQSGQVGVYLAHILDLSFVRSVVKVDIDTESGSLVLQRKLARGDREVVECGLPVVLAVETGLNTPRNATIKGVLKARNRQIPKQGSGDLGLSQAEAGVAGSRTRTTRISPPKPKMKGLFVPDSKLSSADKLRAIMGGGIVQKKSDYLEGDPDEITKQLLRFFREQKVIRE